MFTTFQFPFPTSSASLKDEAERELIPLDDLLDKSEDEAHSTANISSILTLRKDHLVCWRSPSTFHMFTDEVFVVVPVEPGATSLTIPDNAENVLYLFMEDFTFQFLDYGDGYRLSRGEGYLEVKMKSKNLKHLLAMCLSLSYRFGTEFRFWKSGDDGVYLVTLDRDSTKRNEHLTAIKDNLVSLINFFDQIRSIKVNLDTRDFKKKQEKPEPDFSDWE